MDRDQLVGQARHFLVSGQAGPLAQTPVRPDDQYFNPPFPGELVGEPVDALGPSMDQSGE
jgi:hypothetical protein